LGIVTPLETIVEELKLLPPGKLRLAADYIQRLKQVNQEERHTVLSRTAGSLSEETAREMEQAVEEGCERVDEHAW
jgi:hypothetical protein